MELPLEPEMLAAAEDAELWWLALCRPELVEGTDECTGPLESRVVEA